MDYWNECIAEAMEDAGIVATQEQIDKVAAWAEGAHENYGMAMGHNCIPNPLEFEIKEIKKEHKKEIEDAEEREHCYRDSVARRRRVPISSVGLVNGEVFYDL